MPAIPREVTGREEDRMSSRLRMLIVVRCAFAAAVLATLLAGCFRSRGSNPPLVDATATANPGEAHGLVEFQKALAQYVVLRDRVMRDTPAGTAVSRLPEAPRGPLAAEIRRERRHAKQGDVFRHEVQPLFRRALAEELRDPMALDTRHTLGEGNPETRRGVEQDRDIARLDITLVVNGLYPPGRSFSTMPPRLLQRLPPLPPSIDYRFVGRDLVLVDTIASLVIDYLPNAVSIGR
jgi:hypothetical protein